jgi:hypothetical protein
MRDFGTWMIDEGFIKQKEANVLLEEAKKYRRAQYQAELEETIQRRLDELEKLKAQR